MSNVLSFPSPKTMPSDFYSNYSGPRPSKRSDELQLAPRYRRVLVLLSQGATPQEISQQLGLKPITTWGYIEEIFVKNAKLRQQLAAYALGLLEKGGNKCTLNG